MNAAFPPPRHPGYNRGMSGERKGTVAWFWITVAIVATPILYELSMGPLIWLLSRQMVPDWCQPAVTIYVIPTNYVYDHAPAPVQRAMTGYVALFQRAL